MVSLFYLPPRGKDTEGDFGEDRKYLWNEMLPSSGQRYEWQLTEGWIQVWNGREPPPPSGGLWCRQETLQSQYKSYDSFRGGTEENTDGTLRAPRRFDTNDAAELSQGETCDLRLYRPTDVHDWTDVRKEPVRTEQHLQRQTFLSVFSLRSCSVLVSLSRETVPALIFWLQVFRKFQGYCQCRRSPPGGAVSLDARGFFSSFLFTFFFKFPVLAAV